MNQLGVESPRCGKLTNIGGEGVRCGEPYYGTLSFQCLDCAQKEIYALRAALSLMERPIISLEPSPNILQDLAQALEDGMLKNQII